MPKIIKKVKEIKNAMSTWLWKAPAKFSLLTVGGFFVLSILLLLVLTPLMKNTPTLVWGITYISLIAMFIFCIYKLIKFAPKEKLDRHSFVAVNVGLTMIVGLLYVILPVILMMSMGLHNFAQLSMYSGIYIGALSQTNPVLFFALAALLSLVITFIIGLSLLRYVTIYRRGQMMGIPCSRLMLSFPFGMWLLYFPEFFLPEQGKEKQSTCIKTNWFCRLIDWSLKTPTNTFTTWLAMLLLTGIIPAAFGMASISSMLHIGFGLLFLFVLLAVSVKKAKWNFKSGSQKMTASTKGWFSSLAVVLNILLILGMIFMYMFNVQQTQTMEPMLGDMETMQVIDSTAPVAQPVK